MSAPTLASGRATQENEHHSLLALEGGEGVVADLERESLSATEIVAKMVEQGELHPHHYKMVQDSAISDKIILERGYRTFTSPAELAKHEPRFKGKAAAAARFPALAFPIWRGGNDAPHAWVIRPDNPRVSNQTDKDGTETAGEGKTLKYVKYEYPPNVEQICDVLPRHREALGDPSQPLYFTEGARKADALASCGAVAISLNGVWGFRGKNDYGGKALIPDFEGIAFNKRDAYIVFDSDSKTIAQVRMATVRLRKTLAKKGARVQYIGLPHKPNGDKQGVDDFLGALPAEERSLEALKPYIDETYALNSIGESKIGPHPITGDLLYDPPGFSSANNMLTYTDPATDKQRIIYRGVIQPVAWGRDYLTRDVTLTVRWRESENSPKEEVTAPYTSLNNGKRVLEYLGSKGASITEANAKYVAEYLVEYARVNRESLPFTQQSNHYGYTGEGIVGPDWSVGAATKYVGNTRIGKGCDESGFRDALATAVTWNAKPLMLALGLAAASPFLERLNVSRNPILWMSGASNHGKTSSLKFAVALYGSPKDLSMQSARSTLAGFLQRLSVLRGLPMLIDDTQTSDDKRLQDAVYQYANQQSYAKGGRDGQPLGNERLSGAVFLAGEAPPQLTFQGARNRVFDLRVGELPPLGIAPNEAPKAGELPGSDRAALLNAAVDAGAGTLGEKLAQAIWDDWDAFTARVYAYEKSASSRINTGHEWIRALAAAATALDKLFEVAELPYEYYPRDLVSWAHRELFKARVENDPISTAFEELRALVNNAANDYKNAEVRVSFNEQVAIYEAGKGEWLVLPKAKAVITTLEPFGGLQGLAAEWVRRKWIIPDGAGKSTVQRRVNGGKQRVLVIPEKVMLEGIEPDDAN